MSTITPPKPSPEQVFPYPYPPIFPPVSPWPRARPTHKASVDDYRQLLRVADRLSPKLRTAFLAAIATLTADIDVQAVIQAVQSGHYGQLQSLLHLQGLADELQGPAVAVSQAAFIGGASVGHGLLPEEIRVGVSFDLVNPEAVRFAKARAGALITNITETNREAVSTIRRLVEVSQSGGLTVRELERAIRPVIQSTLGLTVQQTQAVENYYQRLLGDGTSVNQALMKTGRYANGLLKVRAEMIARTETLTAANRGQVAIWQEAVRQGYLNPTKAWKVWIVTPDDKLCDYCATLDGQKVLLDDQFQDDDEQFDAVDAPPLHPNCRCATGLSFTNEEG